MNEWTVPLEWNREWNTGMTFEMRSLFIEGIIEGKLLTF
jgi:hypothetical protein